jgi:heptosyltransferase I
MKNFNSKILPITNIEISPIADKIKRVLIIKPSSLGDVIHTYPVIALLKKSIPGVEIDWLVNKNISQILDYLEDYLEDKILFNRSGFKGGSFLKESKRLVSDIRRKKYDCVIDLQGLLRSSIMTFLSRAEFKVGFKKPKERISTFAYNVKIDIPESITHAIEKNIYLVSEFLKIKPNVPDFNIPKIERYSSIGRKVLEANGAEIVKAKYMVIAPGARWNSKRWSTDFFAKVLDCIAERDALEFIIIGTKDEVKLADEIMLKCKKAKPFSFADKTNMIELVELLRNAELLLTNDSGPMHIAAALGTRVTAMFGPTDPKLTGPFWPNSKVYQNDSGCIKCFKRECLKDEQWCQEGIAPLFVAEEIMERLKI